MHGHCYSKHNTIKVSKEELKAETKKIKRLAVLGEIFQVTPVS